MFQLESLGVLGQHNVQGGNTLGFGSQCARQVQSVTGTQAGSGIHGQHGGFVKSHRFDGQQLQIVGTDPLKLKPGDLGLRLGQLPGALL